MNFLFKTTFTLFVLLCFNSAFSAGATSATNAPAATPTSAPAATPTSAPINAPNHGPTLAPVASNNTSFNVTYIDNQVTYYFGVVNTYANLATSWVAYISIFTASMSVAFPFLGVRIHKYSNFNKVKFPSFYCYFHFSRSLVRGCKSSSIMLRKLMRVEVKNFKHFQVMPVVVSKW